MTTQKPRQAEPEVSFECFVIAKNVYIPQETQ